MLQASCISLYTPVPTPASNATPKAGPSDDLFVDTLQLNISANIWRHSSLFPPPPDTITLVGFIPVSLMISMQSKSE